MLESEFRCMELFINVLIFCSAEMLVDLNVPWVILGHSERRALLNETNEVILLLIKFLCVVLCWTCPHTVFSCNVL